MNTSELYSELEKRRELVAVARSALVLPAPSLETRSCCAGSQQGRDHPIELTSIDVMVCRALLTIGTPHRALCEATKAAIRRNPEPWLIATPARAATCPTVQSAARALPGIDSDRHHGWVIDPWPPAWTTPTQSEAVAA